MKSFSLKRFFAKFKRSELPETEITAVAEVEPAEQKAEPEAAGQEQAATSESEEVEDGISGVNIEVGLSYIAGDEKLYEEILETYIEGYEERIEKLNKYKGENDIKSYEIAIHGLKSVSASIGATAFSETAKRLEEACSDRDAATAYIEANHASMVEEYLTIVDGIKKWLAAKKTYGKIEKEKVLDLTNLLTKFDHMKKAIYEYRKMDACGYLKELYEVHVPMIESSMGEEYKNALLGIYKLVSDYDMNKAYEAAEKLEEDIRRLLK